MNTALAGGQRETLTTHRFSRASVPFSSPPARLNFSGVPHLPVMNSHKLALGLIPLLGLVGLLAWVFRKRRRLAGWSRAAGVVIALRCQRRCRAPVVRFHSADHREFIHSSTTATSPPRFAVGEAVVVLYEPADPSRAVISSFVQLWFGECFVALVLVVALGITVLIGLGIIR